MDPAQLQYIVTILGGAFVLAGVGGVAWLTAGELRLRAIRRGRMQTAGGGPDRSQPHR